MNEPTIRFTAYGAEATESLGELVNAAKARDPLAPVTIIVPDHLTGLTVRRSLSQRPSGVAAAECITVPRLAERLAAPSLAGSGRRPAAGPIVAATVRDVLRDEPGAFDEVASHPATALALATASTRLRRTTPTGRAAISAAGGRLVGEVLRVHAEVHDRLSPEWFDTTDLLGEAAGGPLRGDELGTVIVHLPQHLDPHETAFLRALGSAATALHVLVGVTGDIRADRGPLDAARAMTGRTRLDRPEVSPPVAGRVLHATDADDEVRSVVREVVHALTAHPAHRIAVLYGHQRPYARIVQEQMRAAGVQINGPGARPVSERSCARLMLGLLAAYRADFPRRDLLRALSEAPTTDPAGASIPTASWERLSRSAGIVGGTDWTHRTDALVDDLHHRERALREAGHDESADHAHATLEQAKRMRDTVSHVRDRLDEAVHAARWADAVEALQTLLHTLLPGSRALALPPEEVYARSIVLSIVTGLEVLDETSTPVSVEVLDDVLTGELEAAHTRVGRFGEGVYVGPLESSVGLNLDVVVTCGLSEDVFPGRVGDDPLLPDRVREASGGELITVREQLATRHRALLAAFQVADTTVATFARGDLRQQTDRIPSRWLLPSIRALAGDDSLVATEYAEVPQLEDAPSYSAALAASDRLATDQDWRLRAGQSGTTFDDSTLETARRVLRQRNGPDAGRFDGMVGPDPARRSPLAGGMIAPTTLEAYATCPRHYFFEQILHVRPLEDPEAVVEMSPIDRGIFLHDCLDTLIREAASASELPGHGQPWTPEQHTRLQQIAQERRDAVERSGQTGHPRLWAQVYADIQTTLESMLDDDENWRRDHDLAVVGSEVSFGREGTEPLELRLENGTLRLRGAADKVDRGPDGSLVVTDLKTGGHSAYDAITKDPLVAGTRLQLPAYAHAVRARYGDDDTPVRALYWFSKDGKRIPVPLDDEVDAAYRAALSTLVRAIDEGIFVAKPPETDDFAWVQCHYCNPDGLGYGEDRARWHRLRTTGALRALVSLIDPAALEDEQGQA